MLRTRVITALILLGILACALGPASPWGFPVLALLFVAAGTGEWLVLVGVPVSGAVVLALCALGISWWADRNLGSAQTLRADFLMGVCVIWLALAAWLVARGEFPAVNRARWAYVLSGIVLPAACLIALLVAYREGLVFMMSILALVWAADIAAYFVGRAFGRHKLAVRISPGKTVEGALGGVAAVWVVALVCQEVEALHTTFFARLFAAWPWPIVIVALAGLTGLSIVGDLFESHLKRQAGVKDSSRLLPGHGGVLDRIDALLPLIPAAVVLTGWV